MPELAAAALEMGLDAALRPWHDEPSGRRGGAVLLAAFAVLLGVFERVRYSGTGRLATGRGLLP